MMTLIFLIWYYLTLVHFGLKIDALIAVGMISGGLSVLVVMLVIISYVQDYHILWTANFIGERYTTCIIF